MTTSYFKVLRKRNFLLLWMGQVISQFGDRLTQMALIGLVYELKPLSTFGLAKMFSVTVIPVFLIAPVAGVYIDRWNKQKTMYLSDLFRGMLVFLIPLFALKIKSLILVYLFIFLSFCIARFFISAKMALIPDIVAKDELLVGNSLISMTAIIAAVLGLGCGGIIVERVGIYTAFLIDALTFFVSALFVFLMRLQKYETHFHPSDILHLSKDALIKVKKSFIFEVKEGLRYILASQDTRYAAKIMFLLFASIGSLYTVFIVFIQETLSTITSALGWLAVALGIGLFVGSLLYGKFGSGLSLKRLINYSLTFSSLYLLTLTILLRLYHLGIFAFFSCFLLGLLSSPILIAVNTLIHKESDNGFWGRIFSYLEVIIHLAFIIFMFLASYLAERTSPFTTIIGIGIIIFIFSLANLLSSNDKIRGT